MLFLIILLLSTLAIAGSAAFFSVYGLAYTFSGTFWSVVLMGGSLEAGKLVAASYLYRYWKTTNFWLKSYLMFGVFALMLLTSTGIFGYLSAGYQADVLPLKQMNEQITLLEDEKARSLKRKTDIDKQISELPTNYVTSRIRLSKQFEEEQKNVTKRINELDKELLTLRQQQIKTEAHIGPITYIAKAFNFETDVATKWLIFLIIFVFDPFAVALTLCVNIALRQREEERAAQRPVQHQPIVIPPSELSFPDLLQMYEKTAPAQNNEVPAVVLEEVKVEPTPKPDVQKVPEPIIEQPKPVSEVKEKPVVQPFKRKVSENPLPVVPEVSQAKLSQLLAHHKMLKQKQTGVGLTPDELWELNATQQVLKRHGLELYL